MPLPMIARMNLRDIDLSPPKRLAHVPLIMDVIRRMGVMEIIDSACGTDRRMKSSHGECVAVILAGVFAGEHGLWRLQDRLDVFDMATVMQDPGFDLAEFHDVRLGRSLDAIYRAGPDKILTELALRTIAAHDLSTDFLSFDTTTLSFFGAYEQEMDPAWSPEEDDDVDVTAVPDRRPRHSDLISGDGREAPRVVRGYAKNRRHDLKQILYGSVVTRDGGVPLYGRAMDGNTSDVTAAAAFLDTLHRDLPDPGQRCFVADSKGWTPTVLDQVRAHRLRLLSRLPRTTTLSRECLDAFDAQRAPCLLRRHHPRRERWSWVAFEGRDAEYAYRRESIETDAEGRERRVREDAVIPVRVVTCFSSELYRQKLETLAKIRERERGVHAATLRKHQRRTFRCAADAQAEADRINTAGQPWISWTITASVTAERVTGKRAKRGRPRKDDEPPATTTVYRLAVDVAPADDAVIDRRLRRAATYTLVRNRLPGWSIDDEAMVAAYTDQWRVEHGFAWLKSQAAINPMFLETDHRIESLCLIYHIALMIQTLVQRNVRRGLKKRGWKLPYHRNKPSDKITARFTFELFRNITTLTLSDGKQAEKRLFGDDEHTRKARIALGISNDAYAPALHEREIPA